MFGLGFSELIVLLLIVLVIFGGRRLPELGEGVGTMIRNFRKSFNKPDEIDITPKDDKPKDSGAS